MVVLKHTSCVVTKLHSYIAIFTRRTSGCCLGTSINMNIPTILSAKIIFLTTFRVSLLINRVR